MHLNLRFGSEVQRANLVSAPNFGNTSVAKKCLQPIQLGKGKWPGNLIAAFQALTPPRPLAIKRPRIHGTFTSGPSSLSLPQKFAVVGQSALNESAESLPQLGPQRPTHRPRHSIDAPTSDLLPRDLLYRREGSLVLESLPTTNKLMIHRNSSTNRHSMYIPRSHSTSPQRM